MKKQYLSILVLIAMAVGMGNLATQAADKGLVIHEWGTFTSLQGSDGVPLKWSPVITAGLPGFVYNWGKPGLERTPTSRYIAVQVQQVALPQPGQAFSKGGITTLQRMETPVIYFYSDRELTADIEVGFPQGMITEWYPQAATLGPSSRPPMPTIARVNGYLASHGVPANMRPDIIFGGTAVTNSVIGWKGVRVLPNQPENGQPRKTPEDVPGNHYFTARATDSALLRVDVDSRTNKTSEREKFLFYRGVGDFTTPLAVRMTDDNTVTLINTGNEPLRHLFVLTKSGEKGRLVSVEMLAAGASQSVSLGGTDAALPAAAIIDRIGKEMTATLEKEKLFPREATAMVNTWRDSWFAEDGVRVLYLLPRSWTDATLPMKLNPAPKELVRVMVGRAEVLSPGLEREMARMFEPANRDNPQMQEQYNALYRSLGRFGPAANMRASQLAAKQ